MIYLTNVEMSYVLRYFKVYNRYFSCKEIVNVPNFYDYLNFESNYGNYLRYYQLC